MKILKWKNKERGKNKNMNNINISWEAIDA